MKKELKVWAITCIAFWWLTPNIIYGQHDTLRTDELREVVITASKFPKASSQTGKVINVITKDQIENAGARDLGQLLHEQTGLFVNGANSNPGKDRGIYLRGASAQYTLILLDGVPVYDPSGVNGVFDLRLLSLNNIERIEILKGSQSTLYGSDAMAGVINIITKTPERAIEPSVLLSYGTYGQFLGDVSLLGSKGKFRYSAGYSRRQSEGFSEARDTTGTDAFEKDPFNQNSANVKAGVELTSKTRLEGFFQFTDMKGDYDAGAFTDSDVNLYEARNMRYGITATSRGERGDLQVQVARNETDRVFDTDFGKFEYAAIFDHLEGFYHYRISDRWQILPGVSFQRQEITNEEFEDASLFAPYATATYQANGFSLEGGIRFNRHSQFGNFTTYSINPSWLITPVWKVFANYTTGFKAPTLNQLFGQFGANPNLKPEQSRSMEAGFQRADQKSDIRIAVFNRRIENIIIYIMDYQNSDRQDVTGAEVEAGYRITPELEFKAGYTWLNGEMQMSQEDSVFNGILRQPEHALRTSLSYSPVAGLELRAAWQLFGSRKDVYFNLRDFAVEQVNLDAYSLLDLMVSYSFPKAKMRMFADIRNLLNTDYYEVYGYNVMGRNIQLGVHWTP
ncbi:TonB-dependent receptor plug domain-containing protein [Fulvivirga sedimenti]|uniref:TonB-dependent receptor n=1 Tax=Fulvivirga sedimenti TaxID=2879465 RepID=A0A9X1HNP2_9BACT|nr:TonB-dependent receptor [Fulvivirga sedimenti]MCA6075508.1 TonB-dependent receptor [Fulvivirga sedimenti]MCA6076685.1 TonB-dependent receptor [Fulvivirga sedimenti]MCA6077813.1 TonB-dependent receptor [Fulvivirga sedimenti]